MKIRINGVEIEIKNLTGAQYQTIEQVLREELSRKDCKNRDALKQAFLQAVQLAPQANPRDLWHHVVDRLYLQITASQKICSDPAQSWKRASGDAFEDFLTEYYNRLLQHTPLRLLHLRNQAERAEALR